ncbi:MAG: hypothetical protein EOO47_01240 [Flavobacterium sp.]|nr:MAG: hypothetical protein EOO47_01240 [Flavobacterium sp.]
MKTIEEQLWDYIDSTIGADEKAIIEGNLATDLTWKETYKELLAVNAQLNSLDFEEPSMSFTRNVMEQVNLELKPVALKTKVDTRIIYGIASFFIVSILAIFSYAIYTSDANFSLNMPKMDFSLKTDKLFNPYVLQAFLFVDVVLLLLYLDGVLRKSKLKAQKKGA